jgi:hypothetical protein
LYTRRLVAFEHIPGFMDPWMRAGNLRVHLGLKTNNAGQENGRCDGRFLSFMEVVLCDIMLDNSS